MSGCTDLDMYLNRGLSPVETIEFERHLLSCDHCRIGIDKWQSVRGELLALMAESIPNITEFGAKGLVHRAQLQHAAPHEGTWQRRRLWVGVGAVAASAALVFWMTRPVEPSPEASAPSAPAVATRTETQPALLSPDADNGAPEILTVQETGSSVEIGHARVALAEAGRVQIKQSDAKQTRLKLLSGTVAIDLPHAAGREALSIEAAGYTVKVVGTRFWVAHGAAKGIEVGVERGIVRVVEPDGTVHEVRQGKKLSTDTDGEISVIPITDGERARMVQLLTEDAVVAGGDTADAAQSVELSRSNSIGKIGAVDGAGSLDEIKDWIISGELQKSERALTAYLRKDPTDAEATALLASCMRKAGKYDQAVNAYKQMMSVGTPVEKNQARFMAGALLQDRLGRHQEAVRYFEAYLDEAPAVRANTVEARMRLAQSLHALGRDTEYRNLLTVIVREHGGTEAAVKAAHALEALTK